MAYSICGFNLIYDARIRKENQGHNSLLREGLSRNCAFSYALKAGLYKSKFSLVFAFIQFKGKFGHWTLNVC